MSSFETAGEISPLQETAFLDFKPNYNFPVEHDSILKSALQALPQVDRDSPDAWIKAVTLCAETSARIITQTDITDPTDLAMALRLDLADQVGATQLAESGISVPNDPISMESWYQEIADNN